MATPGTRIVDQTEVEQRKVDDTDVTIWCITWNGGAQSYDVIRDLDDADLTANGSFDTLPTDEQIRTLLDEAEVKTADIEIWECEGDTCGYRTATSNADAIVEHVSTCGEVDGAGNAVVEPVPHLTLDDLVVAATTLGEVWDGADEHDQLSTRQREVAGRVAGMVGHAGEVLLADEPVSIEDARVHLTSQKDGDEPATFHLHVGGTTVAGDVREMKALLDKLIIDFTFQAAAGALPTWGEMMPGGRFIYYEGNDPAQFVEEIKAEFGFDPSTQNGWGEHITGDGHDFHSYGFHCPGEHLDAIYGSDRWPMGS